MSRSRHFALVATIGLVFVACGGRAKAAASWTCIFAAGGKQTPVRYQVYGKILLHGDGSSHSNILLNDSNLLISFATFKAKAGRIINGRQVEVEEPTTNFFIIDKRQEKLFILDSVMSSVLSDEMGAMPDAELSSATCSRNTD